MDELPYRVAMIVGVPRSGTTFLQIVMSSHPGIATARETHLFDQYIGPLVDRYSSEFQRLKAADGISRLIDRQTLLHGLRSVATSTLSAIHARCPTASVVLEKTPDHLLRLRLISACLPDTRFFHIVRDPRGVAASMKAASRQEWGYWAPKDAAAIAQRWTRGIELALRHAPQLGDRYRQLRYEDLFLKGGALVNELYDWLGLSVDPTLPDNLSAKFPISAMLDRAVDPSDPRNEPRENFFRRGDPASWKEELSTAEIAQIEEICGPRMQELGYSPTVLRIEEFATNAGAPRD
jgi:hypothetical protein